MGNWERRTFHRLLESGATFTVALDDDLPKLYKRVQAHLNLSPENAKISDSLKQTLRGFISIIIGLSGLSNKMGDRHVREYKPAAHHAVLIVNSAMTFTNFIFDTWACQRGQKYERASGR